jgi:raffinose/stachyose/melibiose transport system substrate-binding protein
MTTHLKSGPAGRLLILSFSVVFLMAFTACNKSNDPVELVFTSWRIDDVEEMNRINALYTAAHPNVTIRFDTYDPMEYNGVNEANLAAGTGADIIFLWPFDKSRKLNDAGYLYNLTKKIPALDTWDPVALNAWTTEDGDTYGVPSVGVTHGIYYNKAIFAEYGITEPATWDQFIAACDKLLAGGEKVIALGTADNSWVLNRVVFCGLGPNFYGGETARQALMAKTMKLTDTGFTDAFKMVNSLKKYLPAGFESLGYEESKVLFASGNAAMFIGGSWEISVLEELGAAAGSIGWFAPPVKKAGDKLQYCFHVDAAIGINKNSKNLDAALDYVKWAAGAEYAQAVMTELPGFFSYTPGASTLSNVLAQKMYNTASTADLTVRLMDEKYNSTTPGGDEWMNETLRAMLLGTYTPEAAAAYVQGKLGF